MQTTKLISAISYNSMPVLKATLDNFVKSGHIAFYAFVPHKAEEDESKDHTHVLIEPNKRLDTQALTNASKEVDINNPLPLTINQFRRCNSEKDWWLYTQHNKEYLASKNQVRKYTYKLEEYYTSDKLVMQDRAVTEYVDEEMQDRLFKIDLIRQYGLDTLVLNGMIPFKEIMNYRQVEQMLRMEHKRELLNKVEKQQRNDGHIVSKDVKDGWKKTSSTPFDEGVQMTVSDFLGE